MVEFERHLYAPPARGDSGAFHRSSKVRRCQIDKPRIDACLFGDLAKVRQRQAAGGPIRDGNGPTL
jgi:hypothetical protein